VAAEKPTWHVLGAGSIGCLFGAYLRRADHDVRLILRDPASLAQLRESGGILLERNGVQTAQQKIVAIDAVIASAVTQSISHLLICTKAPQTLAALNSIKAHLCANPTIILLQNGMGVRDLVLNVLPHAIVLPAITTHGAYQQHRFHVIHAGIGEAVLGAIDPHEQQHAEHVVAALQSELPIDCVGDIARRLWLKLAINSVINPLTALHQCRNGELIKIPAIENIIAQLCTEFVEVARAENQLFETPAVQDEVMRVIRDTAANRSSMLQDIQARRRTEIDFINGFIVKRALQHGIACSEHAALFDAIKHREHAFT
jgi:2-dehydropantoate 2-reductase